MKTKLSLAALLATLLVSPSVLAAQLASPMGSPLWPFGPRGLTLVPPRLGGGGEDGALRDVYVMPQRPGQNRVAYWNWDWHTYDFNTNRGGGGVRLYFYERERSAAEFAVASIQHEYLRLTDRMHYLPRSTIPFILYASYAEFQATNVFFISEGTLGATDPRDLRMAMPFFGSVRQFTRVSTHEMSHQFSIQKIRDAASAAHVENPIGLMPLWFIEGLAEYFTFDGMDPEGDYILRDLIANPNPMMGYALPDFFNDRAGGYIGVYKLGQARLTFLAEQYGHDKVVELLERSPMLSGAARHGPPGSPGTSARGPEGLPGQVPPEQKIPGADSDEATAGASAPDAGPAAVEAAWAPDGGAAQAEAAAPDGGTTTAQAATPDAGVGEGAKVATKESDAADEEKSEKLEKSSYPRSFPEFVALVMGESPEKIDARYKDWLKHRYYREYLSAKSTLANYKHFNGLKGEPDSFSVSEDGYVFLYRTVERETGSASLHVQDVRDPASHEVIASDQRPGLESLHPVDRRVTSVRAGRIVFAARAGENDELFAMKYEEKVSGVKRRFKLSSRERIDLGEVLEVYDPALSPDGKRVAFAGIDPEGYRDLYIVDLEGPNKGKLERLTHDIWSEGDVSWDGDRLLYVSDQTETRESNVYAFDVKTRQATRLTYDREEDREPQAALGGVVFRSFRAGKPDLYLLKDGQLKRITDTASAMLGMAPAANGGLWALAFQGGEYGIYRIKPAELLDEAVVQPAVADASATVVKSLDYARAEIPRTLPEYRPGSPSNWRFEASAAALVGTASVGAAGLAITDLLRDHVMLVNLAIYGNLKLTDAMVFYMNQSSRPELGIGAFHTFEPRRDKTFSEVNYYLERAFGVAGVVRYPFDRFHRVEGSAEVRGIERFGFTDYNGDRGDQWQRLNGGVEPELVVSGSYGYDTTRMHYLAGPVEGSSILTGLSVGYLPVRQFSYLRATADLQDRLRIYGRTHLFLRGALGAASSGRFAPQFFLFSLGNLEGFRFGDDRLLGQYYYVSNLHLNFPVDQLVQIPFFTGIYGIAGFDFGSVFDKFDAGWRSRSLSGVLGTDLALGALVLQLHFGKLIPIGGTVRSEPWAFNLNLRYLYQ